MNILQRKKYNKYSLVTYHYIHIQYTWHLTYTFILKLSSSTVPTYTRFLSLALHKSPPSLTIAVEFALMWHTVWCHHQWTAGPFGEGKWGWMGLIWRLLVNMSSWSDQAFFCEPIMTLEMKLTMALAGCSGSCSANRWHTLSMPLPVFRATKPKILHSNF